MSSRIDRGLALKSKRIVDFCDKWKGFAEIKESTDRGLAANFAQDFGFCLSSSRDRGS